MIWKGLNLVDSDTQMDAGESPDSSNSAHYDGKLGLLGPRKGVSAFNSTAYGSTLKSAFPFRIGKLRYIIYTATDGSATQVSAPLANWALPSYDYGMTGRHEAKTLGDLNGTVTLLNTPLEVTADFEDGTIVLTGSDGVPASALKAPNVTISTTGTGTATNNVTLKIYIAPIISGSPDYASDPSWTIVVGAGSPASRSYTIEWGQDQWLPGNGYSGAVSSSGLAMKLELVSVGAQVSAVSATVRGCDQIIIP